MQNYSWNVFSCSSQGVANGWVCLLLFIIVYWCCPIIYPSFIGLYGQTCLPHAACPWVCLLWVWTHENFAYVTFLNPHYKLSKALNKVGDCMRFQSTSFVGSILPAPAASRAVKGKELRLCALENIVTVRTSVFYLLAELCMRVTGRGRIEWVSKKIIHPAAGLLVLGLCIHAQRIKGFSSGLWCLLAENQLWIS